MVNKLGIDAEEAHANNEVYIKEEHLKEIIAMAAYFKAEQRHFEPGHEMQDWLEAEAEIDGLV
jgi:hypothetical protein